MSNRIEPTALTLDVKLVSMLESTPDAMLIVDAQGLIAMMNSQAHSLFGYAPGELHGQPVELLMPARFRAQHLSHREQYARQPHKRTMGVGLELYGLRRSGEEFPVEISLSPLEAGGANLVMSAVRDLTGRQRGERKFRALLESAPDAMVIVDGTGTIVLVNSQTERLFGYAREALLGQSVDMLVPERFRGRHASHRGGYFGQPRVRAMGAGLDLQGLRRDGTEFPVEISLSPLETEEGVFVSSAIRDVTDRKLIEQALRDKNVELERAARVKDQFLASMSHELRTPLNAIIGFTSTLLMKMPGPLNPAQERQLETVQSSARHLLSLINDILDLAKIEAGKVELAFEPVSCLAVLEEVEAVLRPAADARRLDFRLRVPQDRTIHTDRRALTQILLNLANNAIKFTERGHVHVELSFRGATALFRVEDTGIGISEVDQQRLFESFQQLGAQGSGRRDGAGLGLHLSQRLAALLGGRIHCESRLGVGSRFTLALGEEGLQ